MDVRDLSGRWAVVTGAASGIGRATALAMARRGARLAICDVDEVGLSATARELDRISSSPLALRADVSRPEEMEAFATEVHARTAAVDLLVNNAGVGLGGSFLDTSLEDWNWVVGINLMGVVHGCRAFVPAMVREGRGGHVVNIASMAAFLAGEGLCAYSVTKFGVRGLSEALRAELHRHRIGVTAVCPGVINTAIVRSGRFRGAAGSEESRQRAVSAFARRNYPPERVAEALLRAVQRNRAVAPVAIEAWVTWYLKRLAPWLVDRINRRVSAATARALGGEGGDR